jgi:hypothetical protein
MVATNIQAFSGDVEVASNLTVSNINFTGTFNQNGAEFEGGPWTRSGDDITYTTGNVGIGTDDPVYPLHISTTGDGDCVLNLVIDQGNDATVYYRKIAYVSDNNGHVVIRGSMGSHSKSTGNGFIDVKFAVRDGFTALGSCYGTINNTNIIVKENVGNARRDIYLVTGSYSLANLQITTTHGCGIFGDDENQPTSTAPSGTTTHDLKENFTTFRVDDDGNVGIGTTDTTKKLTVGGPLRLTDGSSSIADMSVTTGTSWTQQQKIQSTDRQNYDYFAGAVSISEDGNTVIVGATGEGGSFAGSAYIFTRSGSTWTQQQKIRSTDIQASDRFGGAVSISGDGNTAIVGAAYEASGGERSGSAYIFTRSGSLWTQQQKIQSTDIQTFDYFAGSVSISRDGNTVIVGAGGESSSAGAAYVFTRSAGVWTQQQKIRSTDIQANDYFSAVDISGDGNTAIVGAFGEGGSFAGSAYIFTRSGSLWTQQQKIRSTDIQASDRFGGAVSISGDGNTAIVGARTEGGPIGATLGVAGAAYIFTRSAGVWTQQQKIQSTDIQANDRFGGAVSISEDGNTVLVGATEEVVGTSTYAAGAAYIFTRSAGVWTQRQKLVASQRIQGDRFGDCVSLSSDGSTAVVGTEIDSGGGSYPLGALYAFALPINLEVTADIVADGTLLSFTGQHLCFPEGPIERGLVVSANRNKFMNLNGPLSTGLSAIKSSESLPIVSLSNVMNDPTVFGVVDGVELLPRERRHKYGGYVVRSDKEYGDDRAIINSLGEGAMWVVNTNGSLLSGDYITTSNISGYGQKQDDDILHSYTVAKITMDCDFNPDDLPIQVIKKDENGNNVLDNHGRLQWEDTDRTQKAYSIRHLTVDGVGTDEANAVWTAAYVGCTYHCG